ncbi:MAG: PAS domain S-box protein [Candidatus Omnitrophica bacterium]|nr:PAS domain S-box protein [Candidatus Omnitrophota bacterium]
MTPTALWTNPALPPVVVGILTALLGGGVLIRERGSLVSAAFCLMTAVGAAWLLASAAMLSSPDEVTALRWAKMENAAVVIIPSAVYLFTLAVARRFRSLRFSAWLSLAVSAAFCAAVISGDRFVVGIQRYPWGYFARYGTLSFPFLAFFFSMMVWSLRLFWMEYRHAESSLHRRRFKAFLIAFSIAYLGSVDYLPTYGIPVYPFGYLPVFVFLLIVAQVIWRCRLVDITPAFAAGEILRTMREALIVVDREGIIRVVNRSACEMFERPEGELLGRPIWAVDRGIFSKEKLDSFLRTNVIHDYEIVRSFPRHGNQILELSTSAIREATGEPAALLCIARDITERRKAEEELSRAHESLKRSHQELKAAQLQLIQAAKMESVGRLAAGVAHEVKNPLATILQGLDYLQRHLSQQDEGTASALQYGREALRRADTVIRGLLDFSTARELELKEENLNDVMEQAILLVKHELDRSHIHLIRELAENLPRVPLDRNKIEQVFVNLFTNAIHAMPGGGVLTVRTWATQLVVAADVEDIGKGISEEHLHKVFDPFFTTKPTGKGTGLGLTVAKNIVQLHGGSLRIENRSQGGVRATLRLGAGKEAGTDGKKKENFNR